MLLRRLWPAGHATNRHLVKFNVRVPIGSTGAVGTAIGKGLTIARTGVGAYSITPVGVQGSLVILGADVKVIGPGTGQVATINALPTTAGVITFVTATLAAPTVAADPDSGQAILVEVTARNSSSDRS